MSVYDNMAFGLKLRKFSKDEIQRRVEEAADILEIREYLQRKPKALSGGQSSAWPWVEPSCASPPHSSWTSRSPTWTPS